MKRLLVAGWLLAVLGFGFGCANQGDLGEPWFPPSAEWFSKVPASGGVFPLTNAVLRGDLDCNGFAITNASDIILTNGLSLAALATSLVYNADIGMVFDVTHTGDVHFVYGYTNHYGWDTVVTNIYAGAFDGTNYTVPAALDGAEILVCANFNGVAGDFPNEPAYLYFNQVTGAVNARATNVLYTGTEFTRNSLELNSVSCFCILTATAGDKLFWSGACGAEDSYYAGTNMNYWQMSVLSPGK